MADTRPLREATEEELLFSLSFALQHDGSRRKRFQHADEFKARITAEHLVKHLRMSGYVIMKKPPGQWHGFRGPTQEGG